MLRAAIIQGWLATIRCAATIRVNTVYCNMSNYNEVVHTHYYISEICLLSDIFRKGVIETDRSFWLKTLHHLYSSVCFNNLCYYCSINLEVSVISDYRDSMLIKQEAIIIPLYGSREWPFTFTFTFVYMFSSSSR